MSLINDDTFVKPRLSSSIEHFHEVPFLSKGIIKTLENPLRVTLFNYKEEKELRRRNEEANNKVIKGLNEIFGFDIDNFCNVRSVFETTSFFTNILNSCQERLAVINLNLPPKNGFSLPQSKVEGSHDISDRQLLCFPNLCSIEFGHFRIIPEFSELNYSNRKDYNLMNNDGLFCDSECEYHLKNEENKFTAILTHPPSEKNSKLLDVCSFISLAPYCLTCRGLKKYLHFDEPGLESGKGYDFDRNSSVFTSYESYKKLKVISSEIRGQNEYPISRIHELNNEKATDNLKCGAFQRYRKLTRYKNSSPPISVSTVKERINIEPINLPNVNNEVIDSQSDVAFTKNSIPSKPGSRDFLYLSDEVITSRAQIPSPKRKIQINLRKDYAKQNCQPDLSEVAHLENDASTSGIKTIVNCYNKRYNQNSNFNENIYCENINTRLTEKQEIDNLHLNGIISDYSFDSNRSISQQNNNKLENSKTKVKRRKSGEGPSEDITCTGSMRKVVLPGTSAHVSLPKLGKKRKRKLKKAAKGLSRKLSPPPGVDLDEYLQEQLVMIKAQIAAYKTEEVNGIKHAKRLVVMDPIPKIKVTETAYPTEINAHPLDGQQMNLILNDLNVLEENSSDQRERILGANRLTDSPVRSKYDDFILNPITSGQKSPFINHSITDGPSSDFRSQEYTASPKPQFSQDISNLLINPKQCDTKDSNYPDIDSKEYTESNNSALPNCLLPKVIKLPVAKPSLNSSNYNKVRDSFLDDCERLRKVIKLTKGQSRTTKKQISKSGREGNNKRSSNAGKFDKSNKINSKVSNKIVSGSSKLSPGRTKYSSSSKNSLVEKQKENTVCKSSESCKRSDRKKSATPRSSDGLSTENNELALPKPERRFSRSMSRESMSPLTKTLLGLSNMPLPPLERLCRRSKSRSRSRSPSPDYRHRRKLNGYRRNGRSRSPISTRRYRSPMRATRRRRSRNRSSPDSPRLRYRRRSRDRSSPDSPRPQFRRHGKYSVHTEIIQVDRSSYNRNQSKSPSARDGRVRSSMSEVKTTTTTTWKYEAVHADVANAPLFQPAISCDPSLNSVQTVGYNPPNQPYGYPVPGTGHPQPEGHSFYIMNPPYQFYPYPPLQ